MPSPFPGMDPYLEDPAFWPDFHHRFIDCWCEAVADALPEAYDARLVERVNILDEVRETHIHILHRSDLSQVVVLKILTPDIKIHEGDQRLTDPHRKVHLVKLNLLRRGRRVRNGQALPEGDYFALLTRADTRASSVCAWTLRQPLPTIPIPLRAPDADIHIDLAKVFETAYERGRYARSLPYGQPPLAPLRPEDAAWAMALSARQ